MIMSKPPNKKWYDNYDKIFKKKRRVKGRKTYAWQNGRMVETHDKDKEYPYIISKEAR